VPAACSHWDVVSTVSTTPEKQAGHGGHHSWWAVVLGICVLLGAGLVVTGAVLSGRGPSAEQAAPIGRRPPPFVVEPVVSIDAARAGDVQPKRSSSAGRPVRLVVPRLDVDAPVFPISAPGGVLTPPSNPQTLGWWQGGAVPGAARGGALITGHTVHTGGGAFDDLETLHPGDRVTVRTSKGIVHYAVSGVTVYRKASLAKHAAEVFRQSGPGRLVLITCEDWNGTIYLSNAVVFADRL
jgi:LPXTG-site transpeptidase (sortase) family protein